MFFYNGAFELTGHLSMEKPEKVNFKIKDKRWVERVMNQSYLVFKILCCDQRIKKFLASGYLILGRKAPVREM
jgi:hypothetical protein